jgi:Lactonase, 7-bladed beta-propeller
MARPGCQLTLGYTPVAVGTGTLQLAYSYQSNSGVAKTGSVTVPYASTGHDSVTGNVSPSGQINAVANSGSQAVQVTFGTDDGNVATSLTLTSPLNALPAGWSSTAQSFSCANVSAGNGCQLGLVYAPGAVGVGTLTLAFAYVDNAGTQKTGTVNIPYAGSVHNNAVGVASPSGTISATIGNSQAVTVTFNTDDANPAAALSITSGLGTLPTGWSGASGAFSCASVPSTGAACQLSLTYLPTSVASGTVTLNFSYNDNFGTTKTGTVTISYASTNPHAYIADPNSSPYLCSINSDGTLSGCTSMGLAFNIWDLAFNGNTVYMSNLSANNISICSVAADGTFSNCTTGGSNMNGPSQIAIQGSHLYVADAGGSAGVTVCSIDTSSGALSNCTHTSSVGASRGIAAVGNYAYAGSSQGGSTIDVCALDATTGLLSNCAATTQSAWYWLTSANGYLYTSKGAGVGVCPISTGGGLSTCATSTIAAGVSQIWAVTINGSRAYVTAETASPPPVFSTSFNVYLCSVSPIDGSLSNCAVSDGGAYPYFLLHVLIH